MTPRASRGIIYCRALFKEIIHPVNEIIYGGISYHHITGNMCSLRKGLAEQIMDKRNKMELFRKGRKNFFKRGYENGLKWDAEVFMFVRKKDKSYTFTNMSHPFCTCQAVGDIYFENSNF